MALQSVLASFYITRQSLLRQAIWRQYTNRIYVIFHLVSPTRRGGEGGGGGGACSSIRTMWPNERSERSRWILTRLASSWSAYSSYSSSFFDTLHLAPKRSKDIAENFPLECIQTLLICGWSKMLRHILGPEWRKMRRDRAFQLYCLLSPYEHLLARVSHCWISHLTLLLVLTLLPR